MTLTRAATTATDFARRHPYITLAAACLVAGALFRQGAPHLLTGTGACLLLAVVLVLLAMQWRAVVGGFRRRPVVAGLCTGGALLAVVGFFVGTHPAVYLFTLALLVVWLTALYLLSKDLLQTWHVALMLAFLSYMLHLAYTLYAPFYSFQHDLGEPGGTTGHLSYIEYFVNSNFQLPQFDLRERFGYQNPPLHHLLAAIWLKAAAALTRDYGAALESLQLLPLFYTGCVTITGYKLLREFDLDGLPLLVPFAVICLHPTLVIFSGLLNNDVLCLALTMLAALYALRWYKNPSMGGILKIAVAIAMAMFTKTSGALVAPAVAFLFVARLVQSKPAAHRQLFAQFVAFGCVCIPLALWWHVYYSVKFGTPLFYVPPQPLDSPQYVGGYPAFQRLFGLAPCQFENLYCNWGQQPWPYYEYSIPATILKTSVFGEFSFAYNPYTRVPAPLLFYSNVAMVVVSAGAALYSLLARQTTQSRVMRLFLAVFYLGVVGSYVQFCFKFPHSCTMNFRYIAPTFLIGCVFIGTALQGAPKAARWGIYALSAGFCAASCLFWGAVGLMVW